MHFSHKLTFIWWRQNSSGHFELQGDKTLILLWHLCSDLAARTNTWSIHFPTSFPPTLMSCLSVLLGFPSLQSDGLPAASLQSTPPPPPPKSKPYENSNPRNSVEVRKWELTFLWKAAFEKDTSGIFQAASRMVLLGTCLIVLLLRPLKPQKNKKFWGRAVKCSLVFKWWLCCPS